MDLTQELNQQKIFERYLFTMPLRAKAKRKKEDLRLANPLSSGLDGWRMKHRNFYSGYSMASKAPLMPFPFQKPRFWRSLLKKRQYIFSDSSSYEKKSYRKRKFYESKVVNKYNEMLKAITQYDLSISTVDAYRRKYRHFLSTSQIREKFQKTDMLVNFKYPEADLRSKSLLRRTFETSKYWNMKRKKFIRWRPFLKIPKNPLRKFEFLI